MARIKAAQPSAAPDNPANDKVLASCSIEQLRRKAERDEETARRLRGYRPAKKPVAPPANKATMKTKTKPAKKVTKSPLEEAKATLRAVANDPAKSKSDRARARKMLAALDAKKPARSSASAPASVTVEGTVQTFGRPISNADAIKSRFAKSNAALVELHSAERNVDATARTLAACKDQFAATKIEAESATAMLAAREQVSKRAAELARTAGSEHAAVAAQRAAAQYEAANETASQALAEVATAKRNLTEASAAHKRAKARLDTARAAVAKTSS